MNVSLFRIDHEVHGVMHASSRVDRDGKTRTICDETVSRENSQRLAPHEPEKTAVITCDVCLEAFLEFVDGEIEPMTYACEICGEEAYVGMGYDPEWLCLEHFGANLEKTAEIILKMKQEMKKVYEYKGETWNGN